MTDYKLELEIKNLVQETEQQKSIKGKKNHRRYNQNKFKQQSKKGLK